MRRYVDVDLAIDEITKDMCGVPDIDEGLSTAISELRLIPTADVEEVVRCKECLFGHRCFQLINGISDSWVECQNPDGLNRTVSDNGFCSASIERRDR